MHQWSQVYPGFAKSRLNFFSRQGSFSFGSRWWLLGASSCNDWFFFFWNDFIEINPAAEMVTNITFKLHRIAFFQINFLIVGRKGGFTLCWRRLVGLCDGEPDRRLSELVLTDSIKLSFVRKLVPKILEPLIVSLLVCDSLFTGFDLGWIHLFGLSSFCWRCFCFHSYFRSLNLCLLFVSALTRHKFALLKVKAMHSQLILETSLAYVVLKQVNMSALQF